MVDKSHYIMSKYSLRLHESISWSKQLRDYKIVKRLNWIYLKLQQILHPKVIDTILTSGENSKNLIFKQSKMIKLNVSWKYSISSIIPYKISPYLEMLISLLNSKIQFRGKIEKNIEKRGKWRRKGITPPLSTAVTVRYLFISRNHKHCEFKSVYNETVSLSLIFTD